MNTFFASSFRIIYQSETDVSNVTTKYFPPTFIFANVARTQVELYDLDCTFDTLFFFKSPQWSNIRDFILCIC